MKKSVIYFLNSLFISLLISFPVIAQNTNEDQSQLLKTIKSNEENLQHRLDQLAKSIDDVLWFQRVGDVAFIDKVFMAAPRLQKRKIRLPRAPAIL